MKNYVAPKIEFLEVVVEAGFSISGTHQEDPEF